MSCARAAVPVFSGKFGQKDFGNYKPQGKTEGPFSVAGSQIKGFISPVLTDLRRLETDKPERPALVPGLPCWDKEQKNFRSCSQEANIPAMAPGAHIHAHTPCWTTFGQGFRAKQVCQLLQTALLQPWLNTQVFGSPGLPLISYQPWLEVLTSGCPPSQDSQRDPQCVPQLLCPCPALMGLKRRDKGWLMDKGTGTSTSSTSLSDWKAHEEERSLRTCPLDPEQDVTLRITTHHCSEGLPAEQSHSRALGHPRNYPSLVGKHPCDLHNSKLLPNLAARSHPTHAHRTPTPGLANRAGDHGHHPSACKACAETNQNADFPMAGQGTGYFLIPALLVFENLHFKAFTPVIQYPGCSSCLPADTRPIKMSFSSLPMMRQAPTPVVRNNLML